MSLLFCLNGFTMVFVNSDTCWYMLWGVDAAFQAYELCGNEIRRFIRHYYW